MANLTITVDEEVLKRARIRAIEQGTTVNTILAEHLARFARVRDVQAEAAQGLLAPRAGPRTPRGKGRSR